MAIANEINFWSVKGILAYKLKHTPDKTKKKKYQEAISQLNQDPGNRQICQKLAVEYFGLGDWQHLASASGLDFTLYLKQGKLYIDGFSADPNACAAYIEIMNRLHKTDGSDYDSLARAIQMRLNLKGAYLTVDGILGSRTIAALKKLGLLPAEFSAAYLDLARLDKSKLFEFIRWGKIQSLTPGKTGSHQQAVNHVKKSNEADKKAEKEAELKKPQEAKLKKKQEVELKKQPQAKLEKKQTEELKTKPAAEKPAGNDHKIKELEKKLAELESAKYDKDGRKLVGEILNLDPKSITLGKWKRGQNGNLLDELNPFMTNKLKDEAISKLKNQISRLKGEN